jgi:hypothetical protein
MSKRLLVRDQQGERERLLVGTMTVGRDTRCDISDADPLLSRRHAEFVCRPDSLVVRDLNSRNGIAVNGVKVQEAVLRPGDVVKIARLVMTYLGDLDSVRPSSSSSPLIDLPQQRPSLPPSGPGQTLPQPGSAAARESPPDGAGPRLRALSTEKIPSPAGSQSDIAGFTAEDERTRVVQRRSDPLNSGPDQVAVARMTPQVAARPPLPATPLIPEPAQDDAEKSRPIVRPGEAQTATPVLPASAFRSTAAAPPAVAPVSPPPAVVAPAPQPPVAAVAAQTSSPIEPPIAAFQPLAAPPPPATSPAAARLADWPLQIGPSPVEVTAPQPRIVPNPLSGRVLAGALGLSVVVFALTAVPMVIWQERIVQSYARTQGLAVARSFAADAGAALQARGTAGLGPVVERMRAADGVVAAVILSPEGRVAAPSNMTAQRVTRIPGLNVKAEAVQFAQSAWHGDFIEAVAPVRTSDLARGGVAWVTYRPTVPADVGSSIAVLGPALLCSLAAGFVLAWWLRRTATRG